MSDRADLERFALRSERVVTGGGVRPAVVVVEDGRIADVLVSPAQVASPGVALHVIDLGSLVLSPGHVDSHVHVNEPGRTEWEGFETATRAAAAGGVTTLCDMPLNCIPVTTTAAALKEKLQACGALLSVDCAFWGGVVPGALEDLPALCGAGIRGAKAFLCHSGIDDFPNVTEADLRRAMPILRDAGLPLLVHAELEEAAPMAAGAAVAAVAAGAPTAYATYLHSRPRAMEDRAIELMIRLCRETGCRVHVVHLSSHSALPMLAEARAEGLPITVETCPHYLCLSAEEIPAGATEFKCAPPIREAENRERLWAGLAEGVIDIVVSDHSPCTPALKHPDRGDFLEAWGGIASLQLGLSSVWTEASARGYRVGDLARWMAAGPARLLGLDDRKGAIAVGHDADLVAWDPEAEVEITPDILHHRHPVTPYRGRRLRGQVHTTWLRGRRIYHRGVHAPPAGRPLLRRAP